MKEKLKEKNITISEIYPKIPGFFSDFENNDKLEILEYNDFSSREYKFEHPLNDGKGIFGQNLANVIYGKKIYWISPSEVLIERSL